MTFLIRINARYDIKNVSPFFCYLHPSQITETEGEFEYEEVPDPFIIETGDSIKVKQVLDDSLCEALLAEELLNFEADFAFENFKFLLMFLACAAALIAQFYPMPFPDSRLLLTLCCGTYFLISTVLQLIVTFVDKECVMVLKPKEVITLLFILLNQPFKNSSFQFSTKG